MGVGVGVVGVGDVGGMPAGAVKDGVGVAAGGGLAIARTCGEAAGVGLTGDETAEEFDAMVGAKAELNASEGELSNTAVPVSAVGVTVAVPDGVS